MYRCELQCWFDNGATGARVFEAKTQEGVYAKVYNVLDRIINYPDPDKELSKLIRHKIILTKV